MLMLRPRRTFDSVVTELADGLAGGTVTVDERLADRDPANALESPEPVRDGRTVEDGVHTF